MVKESQGNPYGQYTMMMINAVKTKLRNIYIKVIVVTCYNTGINSRIHPTLIMVSFVHISACLE